MRTLSRIWLWTMVLPLAGCGGDHGPPIDGDVVVDTLSSGMIQVSNPRVGQWHRQGFRPWRVVEDLRIGSVEGSGPQVFGGLRRVHPSSDGGIWVFDSSWSEIRFFDGNGRFLKAVGRSGEGPGEFSTVGWTRPWAFPGPDAEIWVEDARRRWQRFDERGELLGELRATSPVSCSIRHWTQDRRLIVFAADHDVETRQRREFFLAHRMGAGSELLPPDTFAYPLPASTPSVTWVNSARTVFWDQSLPFAHRSQQRLGPMGHLWVTDGGAAYSIRRQTLQGDTLLIVERDHEPIPIRASVRRDSIRAFRPEDRIAEGGFDADAVPRVYPPFDSYFVGVDGTLWVRRRLTDGAPVLDAFSEDGLYLGEVEVPGDFEKMTIQHTTSDYLYGILRDELGVSYAVRLRVLRPDP